MITAFYTLRVICELKICHPRIAVIIESSIHSKSENHVLHYNYVSKSLYSICLTCMW